MSRRKRQGRDISGILILDKPAGVSSNATLQRVKHLYNANKAGHAGNLDVPATGLLVVCLGEATKISAYLLDSNKSYRAHCRLGITTTTGDAAGEIISRKKVPGIGGTEIKKVLNSFVGEIQQIPPMYSALKHNGRRLYELAYQGLEVERKPRTINIHRLELVDLKDDEFIIDVFCSKGTYIRTLCEDIGNKVTCGAHVVNLRRLTTGFFLESHMVTFESLEKTAQQGFEALDKLLLPMDTALADYPKVQLARDVVYYLCQGQAVMAAGLPESGALRIYDELNQFIGLGKINEAGLIAPKRLINKPQPGFSACPVNVQNESAN